MPYHTVFAWCLISPTKLLEDRNIFTWHIIGIGFYYRVVRIEGHRRGRKYSVNCKAIFSDLLSQVMPVVFFGWVIQGPSSLWRDQDEFSSQFLFFYCPIKKQNLKLCKNFTCFPEIPRKSWRGVAEDNDLLFIYPTPDNFIFPHHFIQNIFRLKFLGKYSFMHQPDSIISVLLHLLCHSFPSANPSSHPSVHLIYLMCFKVSCRHQ